MWKLLPSISNSGHLENRCRKLLFSRFCCNFLKAFSENLLNFRFSKMPCCCSTNVQAAGIIGKVIFTISLIGFILGCIRIDIPWEMRKDQIFNGVCKTIQASILIFGAKKPSRIAILIWMIWATLELIAVIVFTISMICLAVNPNFLR